MSAFDVLDSAARVSFRCGGRLAVMAVKRKATVFTIRAIMEDLEETVASLRKLLEDRHEGQG